MKLLLIIAIHAVAFVSCAHKRPIIVEAETNSVRIEIPGLLELSANDITELERLTRKKDRVTYSVESGKFLRVPFSRNDVQELIGLQRQSSLTYKEAVKTDGPITVRCTPEKCIADLVFEDKTPRTTRLQLNSDIEPDYAGMFMGAFISAMITAALGPH